MLIGFAGKAGAGKTTAARFLEREHHFKRVRFAEPLKLMLRALGLSWEEIDGAFKEKPCDLLCGLTPRYAQQTLGTDWGRKLMGIDLWVNAWKREVEPLLNAGARIVVDDVRFPNEEAALRELGGVLVNVRRSLDTVSDPEVYAHESEAYAYEADFTVVNYGTIAGLEIQITELMIDHYLPPESS